MSFRAVWKLAAKKSTLNAKHGLEATKPKRLLLGTDEISFTAKEQEKVLTPHHDALIISLTIANCLVKRILVDSGSSGNIIFQVAYKDLGLEEGALTQRVTPLIGFSGEVKQTTKEITLPVYAEGINMSTKFLVVDCDSCYNMILGRPWIHGMGAIPSILHQMNKPPTRHTEEPEVEEINEVPLIEGDQTRSHDRFQANRRIEKKTDMHGIDPEIIMHKLQVDPLHQPVKQKRRNFAPERGAIINEEVESLLGARFICEVQYPEWLANVVVVKK
ncbi:uncharacterized protein LOC117127749 [Brassica rapa]|uniref:uncharacterized protein LOC117127749 n=1 Tax=Brassica campestris TaxID=3711 RepID=UPI00142E2849|nr:uncharacterized protein LOC117127749 [Brassica rapa]